LFDRYKIYNTYSIKNEQCFNISILNKLKNSIKTVSCETFEFYTDNSYEKIQETIPSSTLLHGYISPFEDSTRQIDSQYDIVERVLVPKITENGNMVSGSFTLSKDVYQKYNNISVRLYVARAEFKLNLSIIKFDLSTSGVPSGQNGEIKNYIHEGSVVQNSNISILTDDDFEDVKWQSPVVSISDSGQDVAINYSITFDSINDSLLNSEIKNIEPFSAVVGQDLTIEKFAGAYKVVLFGTNLSKNSSITKYSNGIGNSHEISGNDFIQSGCKALLPNMSYNEGPMIDEYLCNSILEEFGNGVKTAEIEWVGSPYINLFDLITLDNGITYRVHYIKHKYDGGYRQVLRLVEYKK
jgi:hypothetical protein